MTEDDKRKLREELKVAATTTLRDLVRAESRSEDEQHRKHLRSLTHQLHQVGGTMGTADHGPLAPLMRQANARSRQMGWL